MAAAAYIAFGSNIAPESHLPAALDRLLGQVVVTGVSTVYRTPPLGRPEQADYRNGVWAVRTELPPRALKFEILRPLEAALGRRRGADRYAARTLDLDLIVYGDLVLDEPDLVLPDPDIQTRPWIALPLRELAPDLPFPIPAFADARLTVDAALTAALRARLGTGKD